MATNQKHLAVLLEELRGLSVDELEADDGARRHALGLASSLTQQLQDPLDTVADVAFAPLVAATLRMAIDLDLFTLLAGRGRPMGLKELAAATGAEALLLWRLLRLLAARGFVRETHQARYEATPLTRALADGRLRSGCRFAWDVLVPSLAQAPRFFRERGHNTGADRCDGLVSFAFRTKLPLREFLRRTPQACGDFDAFMGGVPRPGLTWLDWYPVQEDLIHSFRDDTPLLVDVGGGKSHDLDAFRLAHPGEGRLVLQDQPAVIDEVKRRDPPFECLAHNFFEAQPLKGARAYLLHRVLHGWPDESCLTVLRHLKDAMAPAYSKILIHELVLPDHGATEHQARQDLTMMTLNWGLERSRRQWEVLIEEAGLEIVRFMSPVPDADGIVEVMLG